jgi:opacity protein-like surface antigen
MTPLPRILLAATALAMPALPASAADYDPPIYVDDAPEYVPVEVGSGWYLRGDIGYNLSVETDAEYRTYDPLGDTYSSYEPFTNSELDRGLTYGIGFGYHFSDWIRSDLTLDIFESSFDGTIDLADPCAGGAAGTSCRVESDSSVTVTSLMANGYIDLGTVSGFTPYVGAGAGLAYVDWSGATNSYYCVDGGVLCGGSFQGTTEHSGESSWRFAYGLMAGVAVDVTQNLRLDLGYRYRKIADGDAAGWDDASDAAGATGAQARDDGFDMHEVRVGLRYDLW